MILSIIGLGKLGLPLAVLHAQHHQVVGIDVSEDTVKKLRNGESPIKEPGVQELLTRAIRNNSFCAYTDFDMVATTDMSLIIVPTPSGADGAFSSEYVLDAVYEIAKAIRKSTGHRQHTVVVCSTLMPGECVNSILPVLRQNSGGRFGINMGLVYSPEFIALGSVIQDMRNPDAVVIGQSDPQSGRAYETLVHTLIANHPPIFRMSLTSAEITKISVNAYVTMKISFANALAEVCEKIPFADAGHVAEAIGADSRIGPKYLRPGIAFGGPCFPRDNRAFSLFGAQQGVNMSLAYATDTVNERQLDVMMDRIATIGRTRVGILGLSYKPGTPVTEEAFGTILAERLVKEGYEVVVYDPLVTNHSVLPKSVIWKLTPVDTVADDMFTIVCTPDKAFNVFPGVFSDDGKRNGLVLDCWGMIPEGPWDDTHILRVGVSC